MKFYGKLILLAALVFSQTTFAAMPPDVAQLCQQNNYAAALARVDVLLQAKPGDAELTKLRADIAAQVPGASNPAAAGSIPDSQINKFNNYVAAGNLAEASKLADALASFYPDDPRLPGLKAKINAPAASASSPAEVAPPVVSAQPTGMDRVAYNATMLLVQQAQQASDPDTRKATLERFLRESASLTQKYPSMVQLWQTRAAVALQLDDVRAGILAADHLRKLGAADSADPALQQLLAQLQLKGWLDPQKAEAYLAEEKTSANNAATRYALFDDPVIVKAIGFEIKRHELDQVLDGAKANAAAQGTNLQPNYSVAILNQLITIQSLLQKATDADRAAGRIESDLQYANLIKKFGSMEAFNRQLKIAGMTVKELRDKATQEAVAKVTLKRELNIVVTDEDAREFYYKHLADFKQPETAHVRHILLLTINPATSSPLPASTVSAKHNQIYELLSQIRGGADFATLAGQYSEDPGSKDKGGELADFSRGQMVPEFESAAFSLTDGQVSDVITTKFGYHIIKMISLTPAKQYEFTDIVPASNKTVAEICKTEVESQKTTALAPTYIKHLRNEQHVAITDPTLEAQDENVRANAR